MSWDAPKTNELIELYRDNAILWDLRDPSYKDNRKKLKIWENIAGKFDCSAKDAKEKVKNLRTTFHRYRKKKSGSGANQNPWQFYNSLTFLLEVDNPKKGISTDGDMLFEIDDFSPCGEEAREYDTQTPEVDYDPIQSTPQMVFSTPSSVGKRRKKQADEDTQRANEAYEVLKIASQRDEFATYDDYVGNELRNLTQTAQAIVKNKINNILFDAAMGKFDTIDNGSSSNQ